MPDEKGRALVIRVCEKTANGEVPWERTPNAGVFQSSVGKYVFRLWSQGQAGSETYHLSLRDSNGDLLETFDDEQFDKPGDAQKDSSFYKKMGDMFRIAKRQAMGVDKAIDELLDELG